MNLSKSKSNTVARWLGKMAFDVELNGHHFTIDAEENVGGEDQGPRPKPLLLVALAGCTGMDVVSIMRKMKIKDYTLDVKVEGEQEIEFPKAFKKIEVIFDFEGKDLPVTKLKKAVTLSETRYCGVSDMLRKAAELKTIIKINGEIV